MQKLLFAPAAVCCVVRPKDPSEPSGASRASVVWGCSLKWQRELEPCLAQLSSGLPRSLGEAGGKTQAYMP